MLTGDLRNKIDRIWDAVWAGGITTPLNVIEQLTYLLFIRRLDDVHTAAENRYNRARLRNPDATFEGRIFPEGTYRPDERSSRSFDYQELRWSRFKDFEPRRMYETIEYGVFPFIKTRLSAEDSAFTQHMEGARFGFPRDNVALLANIVEQLNDVPMHNRDLMGDLYEYLLSKLQSAGQSGQFRTPRHIIQLMVAMTAPTAADNICDPAMGTAGFLVAAAEYLMDERGVRLPDATRFHGFDFDATMLRVGTMNLILHGLEQPNIRRQNSLATTAADETAAYSLILANPPFAGALDYDAVAPDLLNVVKTKKTELLFVALFLRLLRPGGRAAVIVPDGVLFGSSRAHKELRRLMVEGHKLDAVISMPSGVFKPYSGVSTAILLFTRTDSGGTDRVWFYDMQADGFSLDDKRTALGSNGKQTHAQNNLPDILARWQNRAAETDRPRTAQSFMVPKAEIAGNDYDLSINRYKELVYEAVDHDPPRKILAELRALEEEILEGLDELEEMLA